MAKNLDFVYECLCLAAQRLRIWDKFCQFAKVLTGSLRVHARLLHTDYLKQQKAVSTNTGISKVKIPLSFLL